MTGIPADFDSIAEIARRMKLDAVAEFGNNPDEELSDLRNFVVMARNGDQIGIVHVGTGAEAVRQVCYLAASLMRIHELFLVADARMRAYPADEPPKDVHAGQFQEEWEAGQREDLTESLIVYRVPMAGDPTAVMYPYRRQGTTLTWLPHSGQQKDMGGATLEYTRKGFADAQRGWAEMQPIMDQMAQELGIEAREDYHIDRACARYLTTQTDALVTLFGGGISEQESFMEGEQVKV
jgi:hypothetical protein